MILGRISKVNGTRISATFYDRVPPHIVNNGVVTAAPRINSYVKTGVGLETVICQIVGEHEAEYDRRERIEKAGYAQPVGPFIVDLEVRGHLIDGSFRVGLRVMPIVGATLESLDFESLKLIHASQVNNTIELGVSIFDDSPVSLDANRLMASHIGVFGNTGSGKSNTLARLLHEYISSFECKNINTKVMVFDLNNEYGKSAIVEEQYKTVYRLPCEDDEAKIPLDIQSLTEDNWGTLFRATTLTQMPIVRRALRKWNASLDLITEIIDDILKKRSQVILALRQYAYEYITGIEQLNYNSHTDGFYYTDTKVYINTKSDIRKIRKCTADSQLTDFYLWLVLEVARAADSGLNYEYVQPLLPRAKFVIKDLEGLFHFKSGGKFLEIFKGNSVAVIQLGDVNHLNRGIIAALLAELCFQDAVSSKGNDKVKKITTIVMDEAHNLLSYGQSENDIIHDNTRKVFETIVKEGRKFGVFLCLASQRPSDISSTITSQLHNFCIHKLVNPNDIDRIRRTVSFMGEDSLALLSVLGQGECIISGPALSMPQFVYVDHLEEECRPHSEDIQIFGENGILRDGNASDNQE